MKKILTERPPQIWPWKEIYNSSNSICQGVAGQREVVFWCGGALSTPPRPQSRPVVLDSPHHQHGCALGRMLTVGETRVLLQRGVPLRCRETVTCPSLRT